MWVRCWRMCWSAVTAHWMKQGRWRGSWSAGRRLLAVGAPWRLACWVSWDVWLWRQQTGGGTALCSAGPASPMAVGCRAMLPRRPAHFRRQHMQTPPPTRL